MDVMADRLAICRLAPDAAIPAWAIAQPFFTVSRTSEELSVICRAELVPADVVTSAYWHAIRLRGPFELSLVGVLLSVAGPLAAAGVAIMPIATYDTDYVLVRAGQLACAVEALVRAGHTVYPAAPPAAWWAASSADPSSVEKFSI
jgi:hypothetical protein